MTDDSIRPAPGVEPACPACAEPVDGADHFCEACGHDLTLSVPPSSPSSPSAASSAGPSAGPSGGSSAASSAASSTAPSAGPSGVSSAGPAPGPSAGTSAVSPAASPPVGQGDPARETQRHADDSGAGGATPCPNCGTPAIGLDGYCEHCGRRQLADRDHVEVALDGVCGISDKGLRHHHNEDAMAMTVLDDVAGTGPVVVAVVSDGVSTSPRPQDASQAAVETGAAVLAERLAALSIDGTDRGAADHGARGSGYPGSAGAAHSDSGYSGSGYSGSGGAAVTPLDAATLEAVTLEAGNRAAAAVADLAGNGRPAPACTYVSAVVTADTVTVGWVGDSRAYWLGWGVGGAAPSRALTRDDSWATHMVALGVMDEAEAQASRRAHTLTGWLGADAGKIEVHVDTFTPGGPGVVLVCSDGLWNYLPAAEQLAAAVPDAAADPVGAARTLVRTALDAGGRDNITVAVIPFPPLRPGPYHSPSGPGTSAERSPGPMGAPGPTGAPGSTGGPGPMGAPGSTGAPGRTPPPEPPAGGATSWGASG